MSFTPRLLYSRHPLNGRLSGFKSQSGHFGEETSMAVLGVATTIETKCVLYGCGTWSITLRGEFRHAVNIWTLEGGWRKLHSEDLND